MVFLAADLRLFQGKQVFLLASILAIQLLHLALLSWSMRVLGGWRGSLWRAGTGLAAFCLFCPPQWENFTWGFQVCFVLPPFLATLSFVALLVYWTRSQQQPDQQPSATYLVISVLAALGATYSLASGNLLWPLLVAAALYLRLSVRAVLGFAITGVLSTALFLHHYVLAPRPGFANPIASMGAPFRLLEYWSVFFISSWVRHESRELIALSGLGIAVIVATLLFPLLSRTRHFHAFSIQLSLTVFFCAGTGFMAATGRLNRGIWQATHSRYQTVALFSWCCVGLLALGCAFYGPPKVRHSFLVAQVCLLVVFARGAVLARYPISEARDQEFTQQAAADALLTNVNDPATLRDTDPQIDRLLRAVRYLKENRLSVFSGGVASELGKPLESVFSLAGTGDCAGALESVAPIDSPTGHGLRMLGWAWDLKHRQPASAVVVTINGTIAGLGAVGRWDPSVPTAHRGVSSNNIGFVAFVPEPPPGSIVRTYAILQGTRPAACYLPDNMGGRAVASYVR